MLRLFLGLLLILSGGAAAAQQPGPPQTVATPKPAKPAPKKTAKKTPPKPKSPIARELFGAATEPAPLAARSIGGYAKGCLAGGLSLPINGPDWQVMRLSRNRNWGNPRLLDYLERLASDARAFDDWPGLLVGDMSQPRGGPMLTGHTSHQVGLDADIWLTPMPDRILTPQEREDMTAVSMLKDPFTVDPQIFTLLHVKLIKRAASYPQVARIFVHPAIKKALCQQASKAGKDTYLARQGQAVVEPSLPFPCAALLPAGGARLRQSKADHRRQWLRQGADQLVRHVEEGGDRGGDVAKAGRQTLDRQAAAHHGCSSRKNATRC